jgi:hypothetical protein
MGVWNVETELDVLFRQRDVILLPAEGIEVYIRQERQYTADLVNVIFP